MIQKQIVYTRTDSVKSSATIYPHTSQGGTKVVRLIRDNEGFQDTSRSTITSSALKGGGYVRKIQTPSVFLST
jgi:hypothetical protein